MKLNTFGIFSVLTAASLVVTSGAEAKIRKEKIQTIVAQSAKVQKQLAQMKYKPGNYVVRAIEFSVKGTGSSRVVTMITDVSPKILTLSAAVVADASSGAAIKRSVDLAKAAAKSKTKNNDLKGLLYITVTADGVVTRLTDLSKVSNVDKNDVQKIAFIESLKKKRASSVTNPYNTSAEFNASILATEAQLNELYNDVDPLNEDYMDLMDNCFNRSHYWARSNEIGVTGKNTERVERQGGQLSSRAKTANFSIHSEKVFVLFTRRYQTEFDHKWWYHTAPTVALKSADERYVLDRSYTDEPMTVEEWVYTFAGHASPDGKIKCKRIENLQEYYDQNDTGYCFWIEGLNMYTYTPNDTMSPNSENQWSCDSLYGVTQGVPYPKLPYGPRPKNASELKVGREAVEYNDYVTSEENQKGWTKVNGGQFIPDYCK
ncbi:MAG: hypothetical protein K2X47_04645 [Bdellovibrionales bacterium]|nr:hypothetical protein [Bdellovibrionales bacterium]